MSLRSGPKQNQNRKWNESRPLLSCQREMSQPYIAQYQTTRVRTLFVTYKRICVLTPSAILTLDPSDFRCAVT